VSKAIEIEIETETENETETWLSLGFGLVYQDFTKTLSVSIQSRQTPRPKTVKAQLVLVGFDF
jgi:hypothetical protein